MSAPTTTRPPNRNVEALAANVAHAIHDALTTFTFHDGPLANHVASFTITGLTDTAHATTVNATPQPGQRTATRPTVDDVLDPWNPLWHDPAERLATLNGPWLHPETRFQITDPVYLAEGRSTLLIGCIDRNNPTRGRERWNPNIDPFFNDVGVIAFPVQPGPMMEFMLDGYTGTTAGTWGACIAVARAAAHETLELTQTRPGVPVLDPHNPDVNVFVTVTFADGTSDTGLA